MKSNGRAADPRVALVSVGLGRVQRGFERWASDLFNVLHDKLDFTIYKSGGTRNDLERVPAWLRPVTAFARTAPLGRTEYHRDCLAFGLCMLPDLMRGRFDVIHCVDPPVAVVLQHLRRITRFSARILFTEGSAIPPGYYPRVDHFHHVSQVAFQDAIAMGVPESQMTLIPSGVHTGRFTRVAERDKLREKYGVPKSTFVILAISAVKKVHKRVDHIIEEISRIEGDILLWLDGNPEDPAVAEMARTKLGPRCRMTHLPSDQVHELYQMADLLVHASLEESFGLSIVEALSSGLPVLVHQSPHFQWLVQDSNSLLDMRVGGLLETRVRELLCRRDELQALAATRAENVRSRFDWNSLVPDYIKMYRKVASLND